MTSVLFATVFLTTFTLFARPAFHQSDRRVARRRTRNLLGDGERVEPIDPRSISPNVRQARQFESLSFRDSAMCLDDIARRIRLGDTPIVAFCDAIAANPPMARACGTSTVGAHRTVDLDQTTRELSSRQSEEVREFAVAVRTALVGRALSASGLDRASRTHRDRWAVREEKRSATAASRYSMTALTVMPIAGLVISPVWGGAPVTELLSSSGAAVALVVGAALNVAGFMWSRRITASLS